MADPFISAREFHLLKKEIEALGEQLSQEILTRKEETERLRIAIEALAAKKSKPQLHAVDVPAADRPGYT